MRRKTIENNMKSFFKLSSDTISEIVKMAGLKPGTRGETLNTQELVNLANEINKFIK